jgi:hypothetical protein
MDLNTPFPRKPSSRRGAALVIVLAFVVLLSSLVLFFFSQAGNHRSLATTSSNDFKSSTIGQSALQVVVSDLLQEISTGSTVTTYTVAAPGTNFYLNVPTTNLFAVPQQFGSPSPLIPNLIGVSVRNDTPATGSPHVSCLASAVNSTTNPALGGQYVSLARWNKHFLIPRDASVAGTTSLNTTPIAAFTAPDWVYVTGNGPTQLTTPTNTVIGRYAYAIYNEGGLLDANVVGFPSGTPTNTAPDPTSTTLQAWGSGLKGPAAFADLTVTNTTTEQPILTQTQIDQLIGYRNTASAQASGDFSSGYSFNSPNIYHDYVALNTNGFLETSGQTNTAGTTDSAFTSRQALIQYFKTQSTSAYAFPLDSLQYLGTFSRALEQPCYVPPVGRPMVQASALAVSKSGGGTLPFGTGNDAYQTDRYSTAPTTNSPTDIKPPMLSVRVATTFQRPDNTTAVVGEPLLKKRFPLSRLSLITSTSTATQSQTDPIYRNFGLYRNSASLPWNYNHDPSNTSGIDRLSAVASLGREPDFFELLKAAINVGSIGKGAAYSSSNSESNSFSISGNVGNILQNRDKLTALQILQIGANIIDQSKSDNFPTCIQFPGDTSNPINQVSGSEDLPYLYRLRNWITEYSVGGSTQLAFLLQPELWDPYSYNASSNFGSSAFVKASNTPQKFQIRLQVDPSVPSTVSPVTLTITYQHNNPAPPPATISDSVPAPYVSVNPPNYKGDATTGILSFNAGELNGFWGFREPTLLAVPGLPSNANFGTTLPTYTDVNNGTKFAGFLIGTFSNVNPPVPTDVLEKVDIDPAATEPSCLRIYLDYQNSSGTFVNYDQEVIEYQGGATSLDVHTIFNYKTYAAALAAMDWNGFVRTDPRTTRWGAAYSEFLYDFPTLNASDNEFGTERADGGISFGSHLGGRADLGIVGTHADYGKQYEGFQHGYWAENSIRSTYQASVGNDTMSDSYPFYRYIRDPDGVARRAMAGYVTDNTNGGNLASSNQPLTGLPLAWATTTMPGGTTATGVQVGTVSAADTAYDSRPTILHRPFRSVAELGYAFRETPWCNVNFTFPESGDAALLDVFCINEISDPNGMVAGRVDLNSRQAPVLAALMSGTLLDKDNSSSPILTQTMASQLATQLVTRTSNSQFVATDGPLTSRASLVGTWVGSSNPTSSGSALGAAVPPNPDTFYSGFSHDIGTSAVPSINGTPTVALIPRQRDAVMRGLVDSGTTRTWNLLIDLVAQSGRFPPGIPSSTTGLAEFVVEGEKHYWLHVAIDRYTGKVIDSQLEVVKE